MRMVTPNPPRTSHRRACLVLGSGSLATERSYGESTLTSVLVYSGPAFLLSELAALQKEGLEPETGPQHSGGQVSFFAGR